MHVVMLYQGFKTATVKSGYACAEVSMSDAGTATRLALLAVRGGALTAVPIGTRLPLLRILLGGGDGSLWFSGMLNTGSCGSRVSAVLLGLIDSAGVCSVTPCTQCILVVLSQMSWHLSKDCLNLYKTSTSFAAHLEVVQW